MEDGDQGETGCGLCGSHITPSQLFFYLSHKHFEDSTVKAGVLTTSNGCFAGVDQRQRGIKRRIKEERGI